MFNTRLQKILLVVFVISIVLFSRFFPVFYAASGTPSGYKYVGQTSSYDPWDINIYVAAIRYGQHGHLKLINQYTTTDDRGAIIYPLYTITGSLFPTLDPYLIFHILTATTTVIICLVVFLLTYKIVGNFLYSVLSIVLVTRGGGFGWLMVNLFGDKIFSADLFYSGITFSSALQKAHEGLGVTSLIVSIISYYLYLSDRRKVFGFLTCLSLFFLMFFYPYYLLMHALIAGFYSLYYAVTRKTLWFLPLFLINYVLSGLVVYFLYLDIQRSGFFMVMGEVQDKIGFLPFIFGYGIFILLFLTLIFLKKVKTNTHIQRFLLLWISVSILLSYIPIGYSRFFLRGLFFPLVLLALLEIQRIKLKIYKEIILVTFCLLMPLTSIFIFFDRIQKADSRDPWQYVTQDTDQVFNFLSKRKRDGVLASYRLGNFVPAKTNKSVYFGHLFQTPEAQDKINKILDFYSGQMKDQEAKDFLIQNNISFVIYGRDERSLGGHVYPFLKLLYNGTTTDLYSL